MQENKSVDLLGKKPCMAFIISFKIVIKGTNLSRLELINT